jgi:hypothetical protein
MNARAQQHVRFEMNEPEMAPWAHIHIRVEMGAGLTEERAELDSRGAIASGERMSEEGTPEVVAHDPGDE